MREACSEKAEASNASAFCGLTRVVSSSTLRDEGLFALDALEGDVERANVV